MNACALSVVIPVHNASETIRSQLDALIAQSVPFPWEIIIVDNNSTDDSAAIASMYSETTNTPQIRVVAAFDGQGASYARNFGIAEARSEAIACCDADDIVGPSWVATMGTALQEHDVVTGPLEVRQLNPAWLVATRGIFALDRISTYAGAFPLAGAGNIGMRRSVWDQVGGFDEEMRGAGEDIEFCLRLFLRGIPLHFEANCIVHYRYRGDARTLWNQGRFYGRGRPLIFKRLHRSGIATPSRCAGWKSWMLLVLWLPRIVNRDGRAAWCWIAGNRLGQLEGCLRCRSIWL